MGSQTRSRECVGGIEGIHCTGEKTETKPCNSGTCDGGSGKVQVLVFFYCNMRSYWEYFSKLSTVFLRTQRLETLENQEQIRKYHRLKINCKVKFKCMKDFEYLTLLRHFITSAHLSLFILSSYLSSPIFHLLSVFVFSPEVFNF